MARMFPRVMAMYLSSTRSYRLSRSELMRLQSAKLRRMIQNAYSDVPFYRTMFTRLGISPDEIRDIGDVLRLPLLEKADILANHREFVSVKERPFSYRGTAGTSKRPAR